jgi:subtilisin family serine protease
MNKFLIVLIFSISSLISGDFYYTNGKKVFIKKSKSRSAKHTYIGANNTSLKANGNIIINFKDISIKDKIKNKYNLKEIKHLYDNIYLFNTKNIEQTLNIANKIYENENVIFSHPNFKIKIKKRTRDPLYKKSWHLNNNNNNTHIDIENAFKFTKGANAKIGVCDDGIDKYHEDLIGNIALALSSDMKHSSIINYLKPHGTQVSGVMSAKENDKGSVGVSPQSKLYFIEYGTSNSGVDYININEIFNYLDSLGVSVIVNSWGTYNATDYFYSFIRRLAIKGRKGKGLIIIFASGNDGYDYDKDISLVDESESDFVLSVSATNEKGELSDFSNYGKSIDISAPGGNANKDIGIITTAIFSRYISMLGTSASAPIVGGLVALALDINPDLTRNELLNILDKSSLKIGDTPYINGKNKKFGYGLINAGNLVKESILSYEKSLTGKQFPVLGAFINNKNKFIYKDSNNNFFEINNKYANKSNPYGFTPTNITTNKKPSKYLIKIRNTENEKLNIQDLALVDTNSSLLYKLTKLDKGFVEYSFSLKLNPIITRSNINTKMNISFK